MNLIAKELVMVAKELLAKIPKQKWMSLMEEEVAKVIPDVAAIRSHDYWDTATYLYNQGNTPQEAAQEMVILIQKHKVSSETRLAGVGKHNNSGTNNPRFDSTMREFLHCGTEEKFLGTRFDFISRFGLSAGMVSEMVRGKREFVKGWRIVNSDTEMRGVA